jgi:two-component system, OmpR family, response regulator ChvI
MTLPNTQALPTDSNPAWQNQRSMPRVEFDAPNQDQLARVLLVDDDPDFREATGLALRDFGFDVTSLADGSKMFEHFADGGSAEIIVLDWKLPDCPGIELLPKLRRRGIHLPVVFLTGVAATKYESVALDRGALDFVDKNRGMGILAKRLRLILDASKQPPEPPAEETVIRGYLTLRPKVSRAMWSGTDVILTVTEFRIVQLLVNNAGEFVSYRAIYDCVHTIGFVAGSGDDGFRTNVRSSMKRIRNKFKALDANFLEIENFSAFGYRWRGTQSDTR